MGNAGCISSTVVVFSFLMLSLFGDLLGIKPRKPGISGFLDGVEVAHPGRDATGRLSSGEVKLCA